MKGVLWGRGWAVLGLGLALGGCGGPAPVALDNHVFYAKSVQPSTLTPLRFEARYPALDLGRPAPSLPYIGVTVLDGGVHLSRPENWTLRRASIEPGERFVEYVSPHEYLFGLYERLDSPGDLWRDVLTRYEAELKESGAEVVGGRVPVAVGIGQGRAYTVRRQVKAAKTPFVNVSREYVVRGRDRVLLVQVVHQGEDLSLLDGELMRVLTTLEVL